MKSWLSEAVYRDLLNLKVREMELFTNTMAEMGMMALMYQEQLLMMPYYYPELLNLLQQQESYIRTTFGTNFIPSRYCGNNE